MGDDAVAIEFEGVSYRYPRSDGGAVPDAVSRVSLRIGRGERLGILGPNGGGKSTLLKLMMGLLEPTEGRVRVLGGSPEAARHAGRVGYLEQRSEAGFDWPVSVRQVVEMPAAVHVPAWRRLSRQVRERVDHAIELVGMSDLAGRRIGALSGGQRQRALIARAVAAGPEILVLDEPTVGVDVAGQQKFGEMVDALRTELGLTVVVVSHDLSTVAATSDRVACLRRTLHYHDAPGGLSPQVLAEVFSHDIAPAFGEVHVDAHAASECDDPSHAHHHGHTHDHGHDGATDGSRESPGGGRPA